MPPDRPLPQERAKAIAIEVDRLFVRNRDYFLSNVETFKHEDAAQKKREEDAKKSLAGAFRAIVDAREANRTGQAKHPLTSKHKRPGPGWKWHTGLHGSKDAVPVPQTVQGWMPPEAVRAEKFLSEVAKGETCWSRPNPTPATMVVLLAALHDVCLPYAPAILGPASYRPSGVVQGANSRLWALPPQEILDKVRWWCIGAQRGNTARLDSLELFLTSVNADLVAAGLPTTPALPTEWTRKDAAKAANYFKRGLEELRGAAREAQQTGDAGQVVSSPEATPKTDSGLICQADAATFYNIPKSVLSKAAEKEPGREDGARKEGASASDRTKELRAFEESRWKELEESFLRGEIDPGHVNQAFLWWLMGPKQYAIARLEGYPSEEEIEKRFALSLETLARAAESHGLNSAAIAKADYLLRKYGREALSILAAQGNEMNALAPCILDVFPPGKGPNPQERSQFEQGLEVLGRLNAINGQQLMADAASSTLDTAGAKKSGGGAARSAAAEIVDLCDEILSLRVKYPGVVGEHQNMTGPSGIEGRMGSAQNEGWEVFANEVDGLARRLAQVIKAVDPEYNTGEFYSPKPIPVAADLPGGVARLPDHERPAHKEYIRRRNPAASEEEIERITMSLEANLTRQALSRFTKRQWPGYVVDVSENLRKFISNPDYVETWEDRFDVVKTWARVIVFPREAEPAKSEGAGGAEPAHTLPPEAPAGDDPITGEAKALALLVDHPDWTDTKIAKAVPCNRTTLYKWPKFVAARDLVREAGKKEMPQGSKDRDHSVEAWDDKSEQEPDEESDDVSAS